MVFFFPEPAVNKLREHDKIFDRDEKKGCESHSKPKTRKYDETYVALGFLQVDLYVFFSFLCTYNKFWTNDTNCNRGGGPATFSFS